jgi:type IV conjugative transfer system protein TraE
MEDTRLMTVLEKVTGQRNMILIVGGILLFSNLCLCFSIMSMNREVILVPGIDREYRIKGTDVSLSYLEEWSRTTLVGLLDLTPNNVLHKKHMILRHTVTGSIQDISQYFAEKSEQHKEFDLITYFTETKPLEIDPETLSVKATGILTVGYGKRYFEDREAEYLLEFQMQGGKLKLKKFTEIIKPDLKSPAKKEEEEEQV